MTNTLPSLPTGTPSLEAEAKAALLRFLRSSGRINRASTVVLELGVAKQLNRADVVTVDKLLHCYEIKTKRDTLARLERQLSAYAAASDRVTVVAATRHINAILSRVPSYVGILELVDFNQRPEVREVRPASTSEAWSANAALDFLPASEIRLRLMNNAVAKRREELVKLAEQVDPAKIREAVIGFLRDRYRTASKRFFSLIGRRAVQAQDLPSLRIWQAKPPVAEALSGGKPIAESDEATYYAIGSSFGPVPEDVRSLLES